MKICTVCKETKPLDQFYTTPGGKRPGLVASECKACKAVYGKQYYEKHRERKRTWSANRYSELKDAVFNAYGGYVCACCGETEPLFLTIDHIDNNGSEHRKKLAKGGDYRFQSGINTYRWIVSHGFPSGFQVLCSNCNHGKHRNNGVCPHQRSEGSTTIPKGSTPQAIGGGSAKPL